MPLGKDLSTYRIGGSVDTWSSLDRPRKEQSLSSAGNVSKCSLYEYTCMWCVLYYCCGYYVWTACVFFLIVIVLTAHRLRRFERRDHREAWCNSYALLVFRRCPFRIPARTPDIFNVNVVFHIQAEKFRVSSFISPRERLHNFSLYHTHIILVFYAIYSLMHWESRKIKH